MGVSPVHKRGLFSIKKGLCVAIVLVLLAYLAISSQTEMSKRMGVCGRESGPRALEPLRLFVTRGFQGDPWQQTSLN